MPKIYNYQAPCSPKLLRLFWVGCLLLMNGLIFANSLNLNVTVDVGDANCGQNNGIAAAVVAGGAPPYTYAWSNGGTTQIIQNLAPGTYTVTVTDNLGAQASAAGTVGQINNLTVVIPPPPYATCAGSCDAEIAAVPNGGTPPYTYLWNTGQDTFFLDNVCAGIYTVTVTDANGCTAEASNEVELSPEGVWVMTVPHPVNCFGGNDGSAEAKPMTGEPPYMYIWSDGQTTKVASDLVAGKYYVTVTDANGCTNRDSTIVTQPGQVNITTTPSPTTCGQSTGSITTSVSGGTPPYTYAWSNGGNTNAITNLAAGSYTLTLTDANACETIIPNQIVSDDCGGCTAAAGTLIAVTSPVCLSGGSTTISATHQVNPTIPSGYQVIYILTSGPGLVIEQTSAQPSFIVNALGLYTIHTLVYDPNTLDLSTVTPGVTTGFDINTLLIQGGGSICAALDVTGAPISVIDCSSCDVPKVESVVVIEASCGKKDGRAYINMVGGFFNFNYQWSDNVSSEYFATGLAPGTYTVTISRTNDPACNTVETFTLGAKDGPDVTIVQTTPATCNESNGTATLSPFGLVYEWCSGTVGNNAINLPAGECYVTVTDPGTGCKDILQVDIPEFNPLKATPTINNKPDCGVANGSVTIDVTGGSFNYEFAWSDSGAATATRDDLLPGIYSVTVTDLGPTGCKAVANFVLGAAGIDATVEVDSVAFTSCIGKSDASVTINVVPGPGFTLPATTQIIDVNNIIYTNGQLGAGLYCVLVTDANGCPVSGPCFEVKEPTQIDVDVAVFNKTCTDNGTINIVSTTGGNGGYVYDWADIPGTDDPRDRPGVLAGTYSVTVTDAKGCSVAVRDVVISDECLCTPPVIESVVVIESNCGKSSGSAVVNIVDNNSTYVYEWTPAVSNTNSATDLAAGVYTVKISDANDNTCTITETFSVGNADGPKVTSTVTPANCLANDGQVTFSPDTYTYEWSNNQSGFSQSNLAPGKYFVTVTDPARPDCPNVITVDVGVESSLVTNANVIQQPNCKQSNGAVEIEVTGGNGNYNYEWEDGDTNGSRTDLASGIHRVTVTEIGGNGCDAVIVFVLKDNVSTATINLQQTVTTSCPGVNDGLVSLAGLNFSPGFVFPPNIKITDASNNTYINGQLAPGDYCMLIRDGNDCVAGGACFTVEAPEQIDLDLAVFDDGCVEKGSILVTELSGGNGGYQFDWLDILGSPDTVTNRLDLDGGDYSLTVTDSKGCSVVANLKVEETPDAFADFTAEYDNCESGTVTIQFSGNDNNLSGLIWDWTFSNGDTSDLQNPTVTIDTLTMLNVTLIVETSSGCLDTMERQLMIEPLIENIQDTILACNGESVDLNPGGDTSYIYSWSPGFGLSDPTAANPKAQPDTTTTYTVLITNYSGADTCSVVKEVMVEVVNVDTSAIADFTVRQCNDLTVDFSVEGIDASLYTWNFGDINNPTATGTGDSVSHTYSQAGNYMVSLVPLASVKCLDKIYELPVEVYDSPLFETGFALDYVACSDTAVLQLTDTSDHRLYDINGWQWTFGGQIDSTTEQNPVITIGQSGDLTVRLLVTTAEGCMDSIEQTIPINVVTLSLADTIMACPGDTIFLNPDGDTNQKYNWTPGTLLSDSTAANPYHISVASQVFNVEATDEDELCSLSGSIAVLVGSQFNDFALAQSDTVACGNVPVILGVSAADATTFEWSLNPDFSPAFDTTSELTVMSGMPGQDTVYYVRVSDDLGCSLVDSVSVANFEVQFEIEKDSVIVCKGDSVLIETVFAETEGEMPSFEWIPGTIIIDADDPAEINIKPENSGLLIAIATNQYGCSLSDTVVIEVIDLGNGLVATADPSEIYKGGNPSQLNVNAPPNTIIQWTPFEGLNQDDIANPLASPEETTIYTVEIMDEEERCAVTRTVEVTVVQAPCGEPFIFLPNAFTPNNDGNNDILYLRGINVEQMWLIIYNRWGEKVFETRDISRGWDGTFKGRKLSSDVFGYYLRVICEDGDEFVKKGNISLLK